MQPAYNTGRSGNRELKLKPDVVPCPANFTSPFLPVVRTVLLLHVEPYLIPFTDCAQGGRFSPEGRARTLLGPHSLSAVLRQLSTGGWNAA
jgi:hypothetical protein